MLNSTKLLQATLLLAVAFVGALAAKPCEFKLTQNIVGDLVHISVGDLQAFIEEGIETGMWTGLVLNNNNVTFSNSTGDSSTASYENLSYKTKERIRELVSKSEVFYGLGVSSNGRRLLFDSTDASSNVKLQQNYSYKFEQTGAQPTIYLRGAAYNYAHVFYWKNSAVALINKQCDLEVVPFNKVPSQLQAALEDSMVNYQ